MYKYYKSNRLIPNIISIILIVLVAIVLFINPHYKMLNESINELSIYNGTQINFDVPSPSKDQIITESKLNHIQKIIPYYFTTKNINIIEKNIEVDMLFFDNFDDLEYTMYNEKRVIKTNKSYSEYPLLINESMANKYNLKINSQITIEFENEEITFNVDGIYEDNTYYSKTVIVSVWDNRHKEITEELLNKQINYSGAYIVSKNMSKTEQFLKGDYKPYGKLKNREEFSDDDTYQIHYDAFMNTNYSNEITNFNKLHEESLINSQRMKSQSLRLLYLGSSIIFVTLLMYNGLMLIRKTEIKYFSNVLKTGKNFKLYYIISSTLDIILISILLLTFSIGIKYVNSYKLTMNDIKNSMIILMFATTGAAIMNYVISTSVIKRVWLNEIS